MTKKSLRIWMCLIEVVFIYAGIVLTVYLLRTYTSVFKLDRNLFGGYPIATKAILYMVLPSLLIVLPAGISGKSSQVQHKSNEYPEQCTASRKKNTLAVGRNLRDFGIAIGSPRHELKMGVYALIAVLSAECTYIILSLLDLSYKSLLGGGLIAIAYLCALLAFVRLTAKWHRHYEVINCHSLLLFLFVGTCLLGFASTIPGFHRGWASQTCYLVIITGFGEELFFRGYVQSRLNMGLGTPFSVAGVKFGLGLPIASLLFALSHGIFGGGTVGWVLSTFPYGLLMGYLREKTGTIFACGLVHASPYIVWVVWEQLTGKSFLVG